MKNILITGGAGKIGFDLLNNLISKKANITVLDLKSKSSKRKLKHLQDKINIVYGDVEDKNLIIDLVKKNDIIIHYAGIMPPLANLNEEIAISTNFVGTKNIVDAIKEVNNKCKFIYMSFISIYGITNDENKKRTVDSDTDYPDDYYSISLIKSENYIKENLKKFTILRMPLVLTRKNYYIRHVKLNNVIDVISKQDLNKVLIGTMDSSMVNGKVFNVGGNKINSSELTINLYQTTGKLCLFNHSYYFGEFKDGEDIYELLNIRRNNLESYFQDLKNENSTFKRATYKILNKPKILFLHNRGVKKMQKKH